MVRIKRISAPAMFPVTRKTGGRFAPTPRPGPHSKEECIPLGLIIRDVLRLAENAREVREVLVAGKATVNSKVRMDHRFPVGMFDVIGVGEEYYRVVPTRRGLDLVNIPKKEAGVKLCRIENKTVVREGRIQLNMSDGTNVLVDGDGYDTGDTVMLKTPDLKVAAHVKRAKGVLCMLIRGRNVGRLANLESVNVVRGTGANTATLEMEGTKIQVPLEMVFVIGEREPLIKLG